MQITIDLPDTIAVRLHLRDTREASAVLESFILRQYIEGKLMPSAPAAAMPVGVAQPADTPVGGSDPSLPLAQRVQRTTDELVATNTEAESSTWPKRPDMMARLREIYGDGPYTGENAVLAARREERY